MLHLVVQDVIQAYGLRQTIDLAQLLQGTDNAPSRQTGINLDTQDFAVGFVDDVQGSKWLAVIKRVVHEVQSPGDVLLGWRNERLLGQFR